MKKFLSVSFLVFLTTIVPAQIPTTNLSLWLKADAGVTTTSGNAITNWADQSPNNLSFSQNGNAILIPNTINGMPMVRFLGSQYFTSSNPIITSLTKMNYFVVGKFTGSAANGMFSTNASYSLYKNSGTNTASFFYINNSGNSIQYPNTVGVNYIYSGRYDLNAISGKINTTTVSGFSLSTAMNASSNFYVGYGYSGGYFTGEIAELIIYNDALNTTQQDQIYNYLSSKYDLGISPSAPTIGAFGTSNSFEPSIIGTRVAFSGFGSLGDDVTVSGTNFTSVTGVFVNNIPVASYTVNTATSLTFTLPDGLAYSGNDFTGKIKIVNNFGTRVSTQDLQVLFTNSSPAADFTVAKGGQFAIEGTDLSQISGLSIVGISGIATNIPFTYNSTSKKIFASVTTAIGLGVYTIAGLQNTYLGGGFNAYYTMIDPSFTPITLTVVTTLPSPIITSVSPLKASVGSSIVINGSNFGVSVGDNTVYFGPVQATVTSASTSAVTLKAPVNISYDAINLLNSNSGLSTQYSFPYVNTFSGGGAFLSNTFSPYVSFGNGYYYGYFNAIGDLNGDGKPEVVTSHYSNSILTILQNIEAGNTITGTSFQTYFTLNTSSNCGQVVLKDFDNDGKLDIGVYNFGGQINIFRNISSGGTLSAASFASAITITVPVGGYAFDAGDIDGDGRLDLVVAAFGVNNNLYLYKNQSIPGTLTGSSFASTVTIGFGTGAYPFEMRIADLDNDGKQDVSIVNKNNSGNSSVSIFRNIAVNGIINTSSLNTPVTFSLPNTASTASPEPILGLELADFDNDGKLDLVASNPNQNSISVFKNKSSVGTINSSSFNERYDFSTGTSSTPYGVAVGDMNGDGKVDIAVSSYAEAKVYLFRNQSIANTITGSSFAAKTDLITPNTLNLQPQIVDLEGDGQPEVLTSSYYYSTIVFRNLITAPPTITGFSPSSGLANSTYVTITGAGFINIGTIGFGTGSTNIFTVINPNIIVARLPVTATTGLVSVANFTGGIAYSGSSITVIPAAMPSITGVSPYVGPLGTAVNISGSGFDATISNNVVFLGLIRATVTSASPTLLTVTVASGMTYDVVRVLNLVSQLSAETNKVFDITFPTSNTITSASFGARVDISANGNNYQTILADLDADGKNDLLVNNTGANTISIYRNISTLGGISTSSFASVITLSVPSTTYVIAAKDMDGDGKVDIVASVYGNSNISIFRNIHPGGILSASSFATRLDIAVSNNPYGLELADIDNDGGIDIIYTGYSNASVSVMRNLNIPGTIIGASFSGKQDFPCNTNPTGVSVADINGDGKKDLTVVSGNTTFISIYRNISFAGNIAFDPLVSIPCPNYPYQTAFADFDADGKIDMVTADITAGTVLVYRNNYVSGSFTGTTFSSYQAYIAGSQAKGVTINDFDGDGRFDIAASNYNGTSVSVLRNVITTPGINSTSFSPNVKFTTIGNPNYLTSGDIDGDGQPEIIVPQNGQSQVAIFRNLTSAPPTLTGFNPSSGQAGIDLFTLTGNSLSAVSTIWVGNGFITNQFTVVGNNLIVAKVPAGATTGAVSVANSFGASSTAPGVFTISAPFPYPSITGIVPTKGFVGTSVQINGFNFATSTGGNLLYFGSVRVPVQTASATQLTITVPGGTSFFDIRLVNTMTGLSTSYGLPFVNTFTGANTLTAVAFGNKTDLNVGTNPYGSVLADLDNDGRPEVISSEYNSSVISVFRNISSVGTIGGGSFGSRQTFATASRPYEIVAADIDGDGKLDLLTANYSGPSISVFRNISSGPGNIAFATRFDLALPGNAYNLAVGDLDLDGYLDIVAANFSNNSISIFKNLGIAGTLAGTSFDTRLDVPTTSNPYDVELADINGDAKPEILVVYSNVLGVYHNKTSIGNINASSFSPAVNFSGLSTAYLIRVADMDGDNRLDVMIGDYGNNRLTWYRNLGLTSTISGSSLSAAQFLTGSNNPSGLALADFDGDGKVDIASGNYASGNVVSLWRNVSTIGGIAFASYSNLIVNSTNNFLSAGDIDGDGKPDLLVPNYNSNNLSVFRNLIVMPSISGFNSTSGQAGIDRVTLTGSGLDVVSRLSIGAGSIQSFISVSANALVFKVPGAATTGQIVILNAFGVTVTSAGVYTISAPFPYPSITGITPLLNLAGNTFNINGNNFSTVPGNNIVYVGASKATVTGATISNVTALMPAGATYDAVTLLNRDNNVSLVGANYSFIPSLTFTGATTINGNTFGTRIDITTPQGSKTSVVGDFDNDGRNDIALGYSGTVNVQKNTSSNGTLSGSSFVSSTFAISGSPLEIGAADFDNDGRLDIVTGNQGSNSISILRNISTGAGNISFATRVDVATTASSSNQLLSIADIDLDGFMDIVLAENVSGTYRITVYKNSGINGTINGQSFTDKYVYDLGVNPPSDIELADLNGDNYPELNVSMLNLSTNNVLVYRNLSQAGLVNFAPATTFSTSITQINSIRAADFDSDGKRDLVIGHYYGTTQDVRFIRNTSTLTSILGTVFNYNSFANVYLTSIDCGDVDGDGKIDFIGFDAAGTTLKVYRNISSVTGISQNTFAPYVSFPMYNDGVPHLSDLDGDGRPEVFQFNIGNRLSIFKNNISDPATITGISPNPATAGVSIVTVTGLGLQSISTVSLANTFPVSILGANATSFTFKVPVSSISSVLTVTNLTGSLAVSAQVLTLTAFPYPTITAINSNKEEVGNSIVIYGNNFDPNPVNNTVYFGGVKASITAASISTLGVNVPVSADFENIRVVNNINQLASDFNFEFTPTFSGVPTITGASYAAKVDLNSYSGYGSYKVALGDLDGDGKLDMVSASAFERYVSVYRNTSTAGTWTGTSFASSINLFTGYYYLRDIELADIDFDGKPDIILADYNTSNVIILKNNSTIGNISFSATPSAVLSGGNNINSLAIADFDLDGKLDIAAGSYNNSVIYIYKNLGLVSTITNSSFASAKTINYSYYYCTDLDAGDLNGDGYPDLVSANGLGYNNFSILENSGIRDVISFKPASLNYNTNQPYGVKIADLDNDGKLDIALTNYNAAAISIFKNNLVSSTITATSFGAAGVGVTYTAGSNPYGIDIADMDGDGLADIIAGNYSSATVSIYKNKGGSISGTSFAAKADVTTASYPYYPQAVDMDGDGKPDIVSPNYGSSTISVLRLNINSIPTATGFNPATGTPFSIISISGTNLNTVNQVSVGGGITTNITIIGSSGLLAQVPVNAATGQVIVTNTQGSSSTAPGIFTLSPLQVVSVTGVSPLSGISGSTVNINGFNFSTIVGSNIVYTGPVRATVTGASLTSLQINLPVGANYATLRVLNKDIPGQGASIQNYLPTFNGNGTITSSSFGPYTNFSLGSNPNYTMLFDLDNDSKPEIITAVNGSSQVNILRNVTSGNTITGSSFVFDQNINTNSGSQTISIADFNNNGIPEIISPNYGSSNVSVWEVSSPSAGTINVGAKTDFTTGSNPYYAGVGDLDNDGFMDMIVSNSNGAGSLSVFRNANSMSSVQFNSPFTLTVGNTPYFVEIQDIDLDGRNDVLVNNRYSSTILVFRNLSTAPGVLNTSSFAPPVSFSTGNCTRFKLSDIDGDGFNDIILSNDNTANFSVLRNRNLTGTITGNSFATAVSFTAGSNPGSLTLDDFDGDGKVDVAVSNFSSNTISVYKNKAVSGTITGSSFAAKVDLNTSSSPTYIASGDVDADGKPELIVPNYYGSSVSVFKNTTPLGGTGPSISGINPGTALQGGLISITGGNFIGISGVTVNGVNAQYSLSSSTLILATVPGTATTGFITITGFGGSAVSLSVLTVIPVLIPTVTGFNPNPALYGTEVSVLGNNFVSITGISISGINSQFSILNSTLALVTIPSNALTGKATVVNYSGQTQSLSTLTITSSITGFSPATVLAGGNTIVTISGIGFTNATSLTFGASVPALFTVSGLNSILALVPVSATTGNIVLVNNGTPTTSTSIITVAPRPVPTITSITPGNGNLGSSITISGTNFSTIANQNIVRLGAVAVSVISNSATSVVVTVPSGVNYQDITLINSVTGLQAVATQSFITTFLPANTITSSSFAPKVDFTGYSFPNAVELTDLDGDGKPEMIAVNYSSGNISVARNISTLGGINTGSFAASVTFNTIGNPQELIVKDFDNDGKPDVLVHNSSGSFSILKNTSSLGSISFAARVDYIPSFSSNGIIAEDLDGDGFVDIINSDQGNNRVVFNRNTGIVNVINTSTFASTTFINVTSPDKVVVKDLDNDGKGDLIVTAGSTSFRVYKNIAQIGRLDASSFAAPVTISSAYSISSLFTYDVDLDGKQDILITSFSSARLLILRNQAAGNTLTGSSFASEVAFATGTYPFGITMDDFDGDARPDVVLTNYSSNNISVYRNLSSPGTINSASLAASLDLATGLNPRYPASGDIDGDGKPEILVPNSGPNTISIFQNIAVPPLNSTVSLIDPAAERRGREITLTGTNFVNVVSVAFANGVNSLFSIKNSTLLTATVPGGAISGPITITNLAGIGVSAQVFTVTSTPSPSVTGLSPSFAIAGNLITATLAEFEFLQGPLTIGGATISSYTISGNTLSFVVPLSAITGDVRIKTLYGGISPTIAGSLLTILPPPSIANFGALNPVYGPKIAASGCGGLGDVITILGNGFAPGSTAITINNFNVIISTVTSTLIFAVIPDLSGFEGQNATGKIKITTPAGNITSVQDMVALFCTVSPTTTVGIKLGSSFLVTGNDLLNVTAATVAGVSTSFSYNSGTGRLTVNVPSSAPSGNVNVTLAQGAYQYTFPFSFYIYPKPTVTGIMPSPAAVGQLISITGVGLASTTGVFFSGSSTTLVSNINDNLITLLVPANTNNGYFTLFAFGGSAVSPVQFLVAPSVTGLNPTANGVGKLVDISGYSLNGVTQVIFNGVSAPINSKTSTNINVSVPAGATSGNVIVIAPGYTSPGIFFRVVPPPVITNITPGSAVAGTTISIIGANFSLSGTNSVSFNGTGTAIGTIIGDNLLIVDVPSTASTGYITVSNNGGSTTSSIQFVAVPQLTGVFNPTTGGAGLTISIFGKNLLNPSLVRFNGIAAGSFTSVSATQVNASIPLIAAGGPVIVDVTTDGGTSNQVVFTILGAPGISSTSPVSGIAGDVVTVIGNNFDSGTNTVLINGASASVTPVSKTMLLAIVPSNVTVGVGQVQVQNAGNINLPPPTNYTTSPTSFTVSPSLYAIKDDCSNSTLTSAIQGQLLKFEGANFLSGSQVYFNGMLANPTSGSYHCFGSYTYLNSTALFVVVPAGATTGNVTVKTLGGTSNNYPFTIIPPPTISTFSPLTGVAGTIISVTGTGFATVTGVAFAGTSAQFSVISSTLLVATVPGNASNGKISVTAYGGTGQSSIDFAPIPVITGINYYEAPIGSDIQLTGTNLYNPTDIDFNGSSNATSFSNFVTGVTVQVPADAKSGFITFANVGGTAVSPFSFTVSTITGISTNTGIAGTLITVTGIGITNASSFQFAGTSPITIISTAPGIVVVSVPDIAGQGPIRLNFPNGGNTSSVPFNPTPVITSIAPNTHGTSQLVNIIGTNLREVIVANFNGPLSTSLGFASGSNRNNVQVPVNALSGIVTVTVSGGGVATSPTAFTVISISGVLPAICLGGTEITILGANLDNPDAVTIGGTTVAGINPASNFSRIITTVPGNISSAQIIVYKGGGFNDSFYLNLPDASITGINPAFGPYGTIITISGDNFTNARNVFLYNAGHTPFSYALLYNVLSVTKIIATVPGTAITGNIRITGQNNNTAIGPLFTLPPTLNTLTGPAILPAGQTVVLNGSNLTAPTTINVGGIAVPVTSYGSGSITFIMPTVAGTGLITVGNIAGSSQIAFNLLSITSLSATSGAAGFVVTINGTSLNSLTGIKFNGVSATFIAISSNAVAAFVPVNAGNGKISVLANGYEVQSAVIFNPIPVITGFVVFNGIDASTAKTGSTVSLVGTNLNNVNYVRFQSGSNRYDINPFLNPCFTGNYNTYLYPLCVASDAATGMIVASNGLFTASFAGFNFVGLPGTITGVAAIPGSQVTIDGVSLNTVTSVSFGGIPATAFTQIGTTRVIANISTNATISGSVSMQTLGGATSSTYTAPPIITALSQSAGAVGILIQVSGYNFTNNQVAFAGATATGTNFGGYISVNVPVNATSGYLSVTNAAGTGSSSVLFNVLPMPTITGFTPANGEEGTLVIINGVNLESITGVTFGNGTQNATFTGISSTQIQVYAPPGVLSGKIGVSNPAIYPVTVYSTNNYLGSPIFTSVINTSNNNASYIGAIGDVIQINGSNFTNPSVVLFNGVAGGSVTFNSTSQLIATVPAGATSGLITVSTPGGNLSTPNSFSVVDITAPNAVITNSCTGSTFAVNYTVSGLFPSDNVFTVDLMNGGVVVQSAIGTRTAFTSGVVNAIVPAVNAGIYQVRIRSNSASTNYQFTTANSNAINITNINNWIGTTDNWSVPSNWGCNILPTSASYVIIPSVAPGGNMPVIYGSAVTGQLLVQGTLSLTTSGILTLHGNLSLAGVNSLVAASNSYTFVNDVISFTSPNMVELGNLNINSNKYLTLNTPLKLKGSMVNYSTTTYSYYWFQGLNTNGYAVTVEGVNFQTVGTPAIRTTFDELYMNNPYTGAGVALAGPVYVRCKLVNLGIFNANGFLTEFINGPCSPVIIAAPETYFHDIVFSNTVTALNIATPIKVRGDFKNSPGAMGITMTSVAGVDFVGTTEPQIIESNGQVLNYQDFNVENPMGVSLSTVTATNIRIRGNFKNTGSFTDLTNSISFTGIGSTISGTGDFNLNHIEVATGASIKLARGINVRGNFRGSGQFIPGGQTVTFNSASYQTISGTGLVDFSGIEITDSTRLSAKVAISVGGDIHNNGSVTVTSAMFVGNATQNIEGDGDYTLGDVTNINAFGVSINTSVEVTGNIVNNGSLTIAGGNTTSFTGINQTISGSEMPQLSEIVIASSSGVTLNQGIKVRGNFKSAGTFVPNNQLVNFAANGGQTIESPHPMNFADIKIDSNTQVASNTALNVKGSISNQGSLSITEALTFSGSATQTVSGSGVITVGDVINTNASTTVGLTLNTDLAISGNLTNSSLMVSTEDLKFTGSLQTISGVSPILTNVEIAPSASVNLATNAKVRGNIKNNSVSTGLITNSAITLEGKTIQTIGGASPTTFAELVQNNPAGIVAEKPITVSAITLAGGNLTLTGTAPLVVTSPDTVALVQKTEGYVIGAITRKVTNPRGRFAFPVGTVDNYRGAVVNFTTSASGTGEIAVSHTDAFPAVASGVLQPFDTTLANMGIETVLPLSWKIEPTASITGGAYTVELDAKLVGNTITDPSVLKLVKRHTVNDLWQLPGIDGNVDYNASTQVLSISRTSITGFSEYAIAGSCANVSNASTIKPVITQVGNSLMSLTPGSVFEWSRNGVVQRTLTGQNISPVKSGIYRLRIKQYGCATGTSDPIDFVAPTVPGPVFTVPSGIVSGLRDAEISIFPNPAASEFSLSVSNVKEGIYSVLIYDLVGKPVQSQSIDLRGRNHFNEAINVSQLANGVYIVKVMIGRETRVVKLTITK